MPDNSESIQNFNRRVTDRMDIGDCPMTPNQVVEMLVAQRELYMEQKTLSERQEALMKDVKTIKDYLLVGRIFFGVIAIIAGSMVWLKDHLEVIRFWINMR